MLPRFIFTIAASFLLFACVTPTPYAPSDGKYGFSEQRLEDNRFRVNFSGNYSTSRETVENFLLYRAAELTLDNAFDYFIVVESGTEAKTTYSRSDYYPAYYGRYEHYVGSSRHHHHFPYYARGFDWAYTDRSNIEEYTQYSATAYITLHSGEKPPDDPHAFSARQVIENLRTFVETES